MRYTKVQVDAIGYVHAPVVVTTEELEERLNPVYMALHLSNGLIEQMTGINERRWWEPNTTMAEVATEAANRALQQGGVPSSAIETLIYAGVCRDSFEPATACTVAANLGVHPNAAVYDISNACVAVMNGILDIANRIELGQIRAGLVVSAETAREIVNTTLENLLREPTMELFTRSISTFTGGSGAVAVLITDGSFEQPGHRLVGGVHCTAPEHHELCRWSLGEASLHREQPLSMEMRTDAIGVLNNGVALGERTWEAFLPEMDWERSSISRSVCHQVGGPHRAKILDVLGIPAANDYSTYPFLGNIGTVSVPISVALADERGFLNAGDRMACLGIGSGLNCVMLGWEW